MNNFFQAAQGFKDEAVQIPEFSSKRKSLPACPLAVAQRNNYADRDVPYKCDRHCDKAAAAEKDQHTHGGQRRDNNRGDGMGVKHFQKLDVGSDQRNQVSLVFTFKLCGGEFP